MKNLTVIANTNQLDTILEFVDNELESWDCTLKFKMQIAIAVEEIFVNIANYAYNPQDGEAKVYCDADPINQCITIKFQDNGKPYNPLEKNDPNITLGSDDREIGGLGIFMVKNIVDYINYEYIDGKNMLTISKKA